MTTKIQATTIVLARAEGRTSECSTIVVTSAGAFDESGNPVGRYVDGGDVWRRADAVLAAWSHTAPRGPRGGYHKCDFHVRYADGESYEGRFDLTHMSVDGYPSLETHMLRHCEFSSGRSKPAHATREQWDSYLRDVVGEETQASLAAFLDGYAIGSSNDVTTSGESPVRCPCGTGQCMECDDDGMIASEVTYEGNSVLVDPEPRTIKRFEIDRSYVVNVGERLFVVVNDTARHAHVAHPVSEVLDQ